MWVIAPSDHPSLKDDSRATISSLELYGEDKSHDTCLARRISALQNIIIVA